MNYWNFTSINSLGFLEFDPVYIPFTCVVAVNIVFAIPGDIYVVGGINCNASSYIISSASLPSCLVHAWAPMVKDGQLDFVC